MDKGANLTSWIINSKLNKAARIRLFCFSSAGRGASSYRGWAQALQPNIQVCPVQLPGRENRYRETPFTRIDDTLAYLLQIIEDYMDLPFAFFGHSLGAMIGFELARLLRRHGRTAPVHLFVSARRAPQIPEPYPPISHLPPAEFLEIVQRRYGGIPEAIWQAPDLLQIMLPLLRADFKMIENYVYYEEEPFDCPITALGGLMDLIIPSQELEAWQTHTRCRFSLKMFSGDHFYLQSSRAALQQVITDELKTTMNQFIRKGNL